MQTTLEILTDPMLAGVQHGFFTRKGGASSGLFAGLNCGQGSTDQRDVVALNRSRVAEAMGVAPAALLTLRQVHSSDVVHVAQDDDLARISQMQADGLVTSRGDIALAVLTADCQPILLADPSAGVIGACHAGWRGALGGVIDATVEVMRQAGAAEIKAVIGPTISQSNYEVSEEFMSEFLVEQPDNSRFFCTGPNGRPMFDLPGFGLMRLRSLGVDAVWIGQCTYADPVRFYSFRRATHENLADFGRLISAIRVPRT